MGVQEQIQKQEGGSQDFSGLLSAVKEVQDKVRTRMVELEYKSYCGCGCYYRTIVREVPIESDLQNGDITEEMLGNDNFKD